MVKVKTQKKFHQRIEVKDKNGIVWVVFEEDDTYQELLEKSEMGQDTFELWEIFPGLKIPTANNLLEEAALLEQAWWDSGDYTLKQAWFDKMLEYEQIALTIPIEKLKDLAVRVDEAVQEANPDRLCKLIMLKGLLHYVIKKSKRNKKEMK